MTRRLVAALGLVFLAPTPVLADWSGRVRVPAGGAASLTVPVTVRDGAVARLDLSIGGRDPVAVSKGCVLFLSWPGVTAVATGCGRGATRTRVRFASARLRPVVVQVSFGVSPDDVADVAG